MEISIKYLGDIKDNYTRKGKAISCQEKRIDVCEYFGVSKESAESFVKNLMQDKKLKVEIIKTAGETARKKAEEIDKEIEKELKLEGKVKK